MNYKEISQTVAITDTGKDENVRISALGDPVFFRNHAMAAKLTRNLGPPSSTLHVANLPEELNHCDVKVNTLSNASLD